MLCTPRWFVCIWKHTFPLIYRCMGLCNEYSALQHAPLHPNSWLIDGITTKCSQVLTFLLATPVGGPTWHGRFSPGTNPAALVSDVLVTSPHAISKFLAPPLCNDRDPPSAFPPLDQLISAGFRTKSHLGKTACQLRSVFTQKRHLLLNICLQRSKTFLLSPLNTLSLFLNAYRSFSPFSANKTSIQ